MGSEHDAAIRRSFAKQAAGFEGYVPVSMQQALQWIVERLSLTPATRVLDVASGTGLLARAIAFHVARVDSIDVTQEMVDEGRRLAAARGVANIEPRVGDATALPHASDTYDLVATRNSFHHMVDPSAALAEMTRVCRRGGRVAVVDMLSPDDAALAEVYNGWERLRDPSHTRCLALGELESAFAANGLSIALVEHFEAPVDADAWMSLTSVAEADRTTLLDAFTAELAGGAPTGMQPHLRDGKLHITQRSAMVAGEKP